MPKTMHRIPWRKPQRPPGRALVLQRLVAEHGWTRGAEIGVLSGRTFLHLLRTCPGLSLIGVDLWEHQPGADNEHGGRSYVHYDLRGFELNLREQTRVFGDRARLIKGPSVEVAASIPDESLDFVFIDADHTEEGVTADIKAWTPKLKPAGWLTGHDTHFPSVRAVIDRLLPGWTQRADHVWTIPKGETCSTSSA